MQKPFVFLFFSLSLNLVSPISYARISPSERLMPTDAGGSESIQIVRLSDGETLYESNAKKPMVPASVTKVLTSAAMLHYFKPATTLKTKFFTVFQEVK